jgi:hypothetical protein
MSTGNEFIDPEALKGDTFFYIKYDDSHYLKCDVEGLDDTAFSCSWTETPEMMWTVAEFQEFNGILNLTGYNKYLIGYSVETGLELGWLDKTRCNVLNFPQIRLLTGGKKDGEQEQHCGVITWNFIRMENLMIPFFNISGSIGGGSALCNFQFGVGGGDDLVSSSVSCIMGSTIANTCTLGSPLEWESDEGCKGSHGVTSIHTEVADVKTDGKLYEVYSDNTKTRRLTCSQYGDKKCRWVTGEHTPQIIKFNNNFVSNSAANEITDQSKLTYARQTAAVYELIQSFWTFIGNIELQGDSNLGLSNAVSGDSVAGWIKKGNKIFKQKENRGVSVVGDELVHIHDEGISDLTFVEKGGFNVNTDLYKWVKDGEWCPDGYYLHQSRCLHDQLCNKPQHGCIRANGETCSMNNTMTSTIYLKHDQFVSCPEGQIVYGRNATHMYCKQVDRRPVKNPHFVYPQTPPVGIVVNMNNNATNTVINAANWKGSPIQSINPHSNGIVEWHYGQFCHVEFSKSVSANMDLFPSAYAPNEIITCSNNPNDFISQLRCPTTDCRAGIEVRCETAPTCRLGGEPHTVKQQRDEIPVCPFGMVLTGITCKSTTSPTTPCEKVEIRCQRVIFDPNYTPQKPGGSTPDDKSTLQVVLISLGIGLPLIIISAIACLCCIPDNETEVNERTGARVMYTREEVLNSDYDSLRRRNKRVLMY